MIFTIFYMYSTFIQWYRLGTLKNKLRGTLNGKNSLLVCCGNNTISEPDNQRSLENLLFQKDDRIACTVVPKQIINLNQWLRFPNDHSHFPIHIGTGQTILTTPKMYLLLRTNLEDYRPHQAEIIEVEKFGEVFAWRLSSYFELILRTDLDNIAKLVNCFANGDIDINHELKLLKIETVDVEGNLSKVRYERVFPLEQKLKYSCAEIHWRKFVGSLKEIYSKIHEVTPNPKITIENGTKTEDSKKVPISEVKPIKKETKRKDHDPVQDRKDTLGVHQKKHKEVRGKSKESRSSKPQQHKTVNRDTETRHKEDRKHQHRQQHKSKDEPDHGRSRDSKNPIDAPNLREILPELPTSPGDDLLKPVSFATFPPGKFEDFRENSASKVSDIIQEKNVKFSESRRPLRKSSKSTKNTKPPNILVYADSLVTKENVKDVLGNMLNKEKYTIYDLPTNKANTFWDESTALVVVCGNVAASLTGDLLQYLVNGGQLLCLCSDLLYAVLQTFSTAEVREHELVRFSYGEWNSVKMMHHIFCYQPSPAKKQFSKDSDQSSHSGGESSPIAPRTPSVVDIQHNGKTYTIQVQVLGAEETWQTPSLLLANVKGDSGGRAIFSQVHLEVDPLQYQGDEHIYAALKDSNSARLQIFENLLTTHLDMDCTNGGNQEVKYSLGYLLGRHDMKLQMLKANENIVENRLVGDKLTLIFCGKDEEPGSASPVRLPVMILSCPAHFSTVQYFETLETTEIGRLVIYSDFLTSSQDVLTRKLMNGLVVIPRQQTKGVGRSANVWLSPVGCAMFSLQLHIPTNSTLGKSLPLVQHIVVVAIVSAIRSLPGHQALEIGLKWPNDLYAYSRVKIGGVVINSQIYKDVAVLNIGCGVNLDNSNPTLSINDIIGKFNVDNGTSLPAIVYEKYFALVFNELEKLLKTIESGRMNTFYDLYYQYWLHSDSEISVTTKDNQVRKVKIVGIDDCGYLTVRSPDGTASAVQPDGNTFDMLKGLIAPKIN